MKRLDLLDYGRFFASMIVVFFHYSFNGISNGKIQSIQHIPELIDFTKYGYLGVEFFFMISGYVIFFSALNRNSYAFAVSRLTRLFPAYWFAVVFTTVVSVYFGGNQMTVSIYQFLANLSMKAPSMGYNFVDGAYWTLSYELTFYFMVFILLLFGLQNKLREIFLAWPVVMLFALIFDKEWLPLAGGYYYYFSAGVIFAILKAKRSIIAMMMLILAFALCLNFSMGKSLILSANKGVEFSSEIIGFIVSLFFVFFTFLNTKKGASLNLPKAAIFGSLTYPIYLVHAHFGYMMIDHFANESNKFFIYFVLITSVLVIAFFIHKIIEVKFHLFWKKLFSNCLSVFYLNRTTQGTKN